MHLYEAIEVEFTFGKYEGKKVDWVGDHDLKYLDWLKGQKWFTENKYGKLYTAVTVYLKDPRVNERLEDLI